MDDTLRPDAVSRPDPEAADQVTLGFELIEGRRFRAVLDLWDPWDRGLADAPLMGRLQVLVARVHLAVEESARHVGPALDALDDVLDGPRVSSDAAGVTAMVLRPAAVALALAWADELCGPEALAAAGGRSPAAVADLLARARASTDLGSQTSGPRRAGA